MRLITYEIEHKSGLGVISRDSRWIYPLTPLDMDCKTIQDLIENTSDSEKQLLEYASRRGPYKIRGVAPIGKVRLQAPIPYLRQDMICLGINYVAHAEESARYKEEEFGGERPYVTYLSRRMSEVTVPGEGTPSHKNIVNDLDYEAELAATIEKRAANVPAEEVRDHVFGYTVVNDVSARTLQTQHKQWCFSKSLDGFLPVGPCTSIVDGLAYPPHVQVQSRVNGELRQDDSTELLISDINHIISELSQGMTLQPGTTIIIGTSAGVGMGSNPPKSLRPEGAVEYAVEDTGTIVNQVVD